MKTGWCSRCHRVVPVTPHPSGQTIVVTAPGTGALPVGVCAECLSPRVGHSDGMTDEENRSQARCSCGAPATHQAVFERRDGTRFLGGATCDEHRAALGKPPHARGVEIVEYHDLD